MTQDLTLWDLILTPVYLLILVAIARRTRDRKYPPGHPLRTYYLKGLYLKFFGAIFIGLVYQYYYGGGDTLNFFKHAKIINSAQGDSISTWISLILRRSPDVDPSVYPYTSQMVWYNDVASYTVARIAAVLGLFNGTSYMPISLLFAYFSYSGIWAMYKTFATIYPKLHKPLAVAFLFIPSTFVWGSAIFKDTVCMAALGWMVYCTFQLFVSRNFSFKNIFVLIISFYLVAIIKVYIILAFVPALGLWLLLNYSYKIRSVGMRWIVNILFVGVVASGLVYFAGKFSNDLNEYSLDNIAKKAQKTQGYIYWVSDVSDGSKYDLGTLDGTLGGMLSKFPQAVNVTLFRPYPWEAGKAIQMLSSLEATSFLIFTLMVFYRRGIIGTIRMVLKDPNLMFFLIFTLIFAFAVGISTGNFGALSRYKIPCMPFFAALLVILYYKDWKVPVETTQRLPAKKATYQFR